MTGTLGAVDLAVVGAYLGATFFLGVRSGRAGATAFDVDSADAPYENVATAPAGRVSASIGVMGVPGCWIHTRSLPLSPRAGVARAVRAASVK